MFGILVGQNSMAHHNVMCLLLVEVLIVRQDRGFNNTIRSKLAADTTQSWSVGIRGQSGGLRYCCSKQCIDWAI